MADKRWSSRTHTSSRPQAAGGRRWMPLIALAAAGLLALLAVAGQLEPPPTPTPTPELVAERVYVLVRSPAETVQLVALNPQSGAQLYAFPALDVALAPNGTTLYAYDDAALSAYDAASGTELWHTPLETVSLALPELLRPLWVSPDGTQVAVLGWLAQRQQPYSLHVQLFDARSGLPVGEFVLPSSGANIRQIIPSPNGGWLYLVDQVGEVRMLEIESGQALSLGFAPLTLLPLTLGPAGRTLYGLDRFDQPQPTLHTFDALTLVPGDLRTLAAVEAQELILTDLVLDRAGQHAAFGVAPVLSSAQPPESVVVFDLQQPSSYQRLSVPDHLRALAFGPLAPQLYLGVSAGGRAADRLLVYDLEQRAYGPEIKLGGQIERLLAGPTKPQPISLPTVQPQLPRFRLNPPPLPTAAPLLPFPNATPVLPLLPPPGTIEPMPRGAPVLPLLPAPRADMPLTVSLELERPEVWLQQPSNSGRDVLALTASGAQATLAQHVQQVLERYRTPPLLLQAQADGALALLDPTSGRTLALGQSDLRQCVLHAVDAAMVCRAGLRLALIDLASGQTRLLQPINPELLGVPLAWTSHGGIYGMVVDGGRRTLWQVDPVLSVPEIRPFLTIGADERLTFDDQHDRVFYTTDAGTTLRYRDLLAGDDVLIYHSAQSLQGLWRVAPDGNAIVYARKTPSLPGDTVDVTVYSLPEQINQLMATNVELVPGSLLWSRDQRAVLFRTREPLDAPQRERLWVVSTVGYQALFGTIASYAVPGTPIDVLANDPGFVVVLLYENVHADLLLLRADTQQRVTLPTPLGASRPTLLYLP